MQVFLRAFAFFRWAAARVSSWVFGPPRPRGLSLAGLEALAVAARGPSWRLAPELTTEKLKTEFVVPETRKAQCAYADVLAALPNGAELVGAATAFLSHVYGYRFEDVLDAAHAWEQRQPAGSGPWFYYYDLAVVNQHANNGVVGFEVLRDEFGGGVAAAGRTLLVLRWEKPEALERAWCIFEVATTLQRNVPLEIIMPPADAKGLVEALDNDFACVENKLCTIDAAKAKAREEADLRNIHRMISDMGGFGRVNEIVLGGMRKWILAEMQDEFKRCNAAGFSGNLAVRIGDLMRSMGRTKDGEEHLIRVLEEREKLLSAEPSNDKHQLDVALALSCLGSTARLGDSDSSKPLEYLERARTIQEKLLSPDDDDLIDTIGRLGVALKDVGRFDDAEPLYKRRFEAMLLKYSPEHPKTLFAQMNLAMLMDAKGNFSEHERIATEVWQYRTHSLGERHRETLFSRHNRCIALQRKEDNVGEALDEISIVRNLQSELLGINHKETLSSGSLRGLLLERLGRGDEALRELWDVRSRQEREIGSSHIDTIISTWRLARALENRDAFASRREYARAVKDVRGLKTWRGVASKDHRLIGLLNDAERVALLPLPRRCLCFGVGDTSEMLTLINKTRYPK